MGSINTTFNLLKLSMRYEGMRVTFLRCALKVIDRLGLKSANSHWFQNMASNRFDSRFRVNTNGIVPVEELGVTLAQSEQAVQYSASSPANFSRIISQLTIDYEQYSFVDYGSGKGRALFIASDFPFKQIIGVEFSEMLHETASQNIKQYQSQTQQCKNIVSLCEDATTFELPEDPLVVYFFNPFEQPVLEQVLDKIQDSLASTYRPIYLVYSNPIHKNSMDDLEEFEKHETDGWNESCWALYKVKPRPLCLG